MREAESFARSRYLNDSNFHNLVSCIERLMAETKLSPNEFHDAVNLAAKSIYKATDEYRSQVRYEELYPTRIEFPASKYGKTDAIERFRNEMCGAVEINKDILFAKHEIIKGVVDHHACFTSEYRQNRNR